MRDPLKAISELNLRDLGLMVEIDNQTSLRIKGELLIIAGLKRQGAYRRPDSHSSDLHLYAAYHAIAQEIVNRDTPPEVIEIMIPTMVLEFSRRVGWSYPYGDIALEMMKRDLQGPITEWQGKKLLMESENTEQPQSFPNRAAWLRQRLRERGWTHNDPSRFNGPDRKTVKKMLRGEKVSGSVLEKVAMALSSKARQVSADDIPSD